MGARWPTFPPKEYLTLPETTETPWGFGPYMVKEWVKGEKMVLEAHPYWFGGTPKSPNMVISIVTAENAEAQLLGGQVDVLDSTTLAGVTETLDAAAKEGKIVLIVNPGATWEHIDIQYVLEVVPDLNRFDGAVPPGTAPCSQGEHPL